MTRDDIIRMARAATDGSLWLLSESHLERFAALVAAAERERLLATDIHSCHANCERFACVQTRRAVEAEREACAQMVERLGQEGYGTLAIAAALRQGDKL